MDYNQNIRQKAEKLARTRLKNTWNMLSEPVRQLEIEWAIPEAELAMQWAAEVAHAVNGPQLSKGIINAMLAELAVIPPIVKREDNKEG